MLPGVEIARKRRVHCHEANRREDAWRLRRTSATPTSIEETTAVVLRRLEEKLRRGSSDHSSASSSPLSSSPSPSSSSMLQSLGRLWSRHFKDVGRYLIGNSHRRVVHTNVKPASSRCGRSGQKKSSNSGDANNAALGRTASKIELCAVCLDQVEANQRAMWLPCSHKFHSECVLPWLAAHPHCPCCRTHLPASDLSTLL